MTLKYDKNTKLIGGFSIDIVDETDPVWSYMLRHNMLDENIDWVTEDVITDLLEKPKVKLPKFVAEWIEYCKANDITLLGALDPVSKIGEALANSFSGSVMKCTVWATRNQDTFALAWLDGYEVEKEKKYKVYLKHTNQELLYYEDTDDFYFDHINKKNITKSFTKKELIEAGFGGVFDNEMFEVVEAEDD